MTQPTFDFSTLFETYKSAMAPVFRAQQEGLKTLERLARYQFAVAGDYLDWSLAQAKVNVGPKSPADLLGQHTTKRNWVFRNKRIQIHTTTSRKTPSYAHAASHSMPSAKHALFLFLFYHATRDKNGRDR